MAGMAHCTLYQCEAEHITNLMRSRTCEECFVNFCGERAAHYTPWSAGISAECMCVPVCVSRKRAAKLSPQAGGGRPFFRFSVALLLWPEKNMEFQKRKMCRGKWKIVKNMRARRECCRGRCCTWSGLQLLSTSSPYRSFRRTRTSSSSSILFAPSDIRQRSRVEIKMIFNLTRLRAAICLFSLFSPGFSGFPPTRSPGGSFKWQLRRTHTERNPGITEGRTQLIYNYIAGTN